MDTQETNKWQYRVIQKGKYRLEINHKDRKYNKTVSRATLQILKHFHRKQL